MAPALAPAPRSKAASRLARLALALAALAIPSGARAADDLRLGRDVVPTSEAIRLSIDPAKTSYRGAVKIELSVKKKTYGFRFHSSGIKFSSLKLTSKSRSYQIVADPEQSGIVAVRTQPALDLGEYSMTIDFTQEFNTQAASLYRLVVRDQAYLFTQFQSTDARKAFPCWDEPEFKIPYQFTLLVPKDMVAIANTPVESESEYGGTRTVVFKATRPLPSELLAIACGPFDLVDVPGMSIPGRIVTPKGMGDFTKDAVALTPPILHELETYFGEPYPYEKLDVIAVPEYWYGAMENPGAITFLDRELLLDSKASTVSDRRNLAEGLAHELAHMWFGDLVTLRWWDDLWLNESFASWMGDRTVERVFPEFHTGRRDIPGTNRAMNFDARPSTHAMRQTVYASQNIDQLWDELAYDKGQAVLGMFEQWLTPDVFRTGVLTYLEAHVDGIATASDLWKALGESAGRNVGASMGTFLDQPGLPLVTADLMPGGKVRLSQKRFLNFGVHGQGHPVWSIPVTLTCSSGGTPKSVSVLLDTEDTTVTLPTGGATRWVMPNADSRGYYRWQVPLAMLQALADDATALSVRERIGFVYNLGALLDSGALHGDDYLRLLARFANDPEPEVVDAVAGGIDRVRIPFAPLPLDDAFASYVRSTLKPALDRIGLAPRPGEPGPVTELRPRLYGLIGAIGRDPELLAHATTLARAYLKAPAAIDPSLATPAITLAAIGGDRALFAEYRRHFETAKDPAERERFLEGLGSFRNDSIAAVARNYAVTGPLRPQEVLVIPRIHARVPKLQEAAFLWMMKNYDTVAARMPASLAVYLPHFAEGCSVDRLEKARMFFDKPGHNPAGTEREMAQVDDIVSDCMALREREGKAVGAYLNGLVGAK